jgi:GNAT superfamily N-acetyltransferase
MSVSSRQQRDRAMNVLKSVSDRAVSTATPADLYRVTATLMLAFANDPVERWKYPDAAQYLKLFPSFVRAFGGGALTNETARHVGDHAGVALWLPPGTEPDHAAIEASLPEGREAEIAPVFEEIASYHPSEPHWYLPLIGIDPACQRRGYGAALMEDTLRRCDRDHIAAYLESTNPANIAFYQLHGFSLLDVVQVGSSPPLFPMLREPR